MCYRSGELRSGDCYGYQIEKDMENRSENGCCGCQGILSRLSRCGCAGARVRRRNGGLGNGACGGLCGNGGIGRSRSRGRNGGCGCGR